MHINCYNTHTHTKTQSLITNIYAANLPTSDCTQRHKKAMNTLLSLTNEGVCHHKCSPHEVRRDGQANSEVSPGDLICSRSGVEYGLHHLSHSLEK